MGLRRVFRYHRRTELRLDLGSDLLLFAWVLGLRVAVAATARERKKSWFRLIKIQSRPYL